MATQIKFNKYNVTDGTIKVRVFYSLDNRYDNKPCVTIHAKDYGRQLSKLFPDIYQNDSDMRSDYFETDRVNLFEDHPLYKAAREHVELLLKIKKIKMQAFAKKLLEARNLKGHEILMNPRTGLVYTAENCALNIGDWYRDKEKAEKHFNSLTELVKDAEGYWTEK